MKLEKQAVQGKSAPEGGLGGMNREIYSIEVYGIKDITSMFPLPL
jgi:hypothetical protein